MLTPQQIKELNIAQSRVTQGTASDADLANLSYAQTQGFQASEEVAKAMGKNTITSAAEAEVAQEIANGTFNVNKINPTNQDVQALGQKVQGADDALKSFSGLGKFNTTLKAALALKQKPFDEEIGTSPLINTQGAIGMASLADSLAVRGNQITNNITRFSNALNTISDSYTDQYKIALGEYERAYNEYNDVVARMRQIEDTEQNYARQLKLMQKQAEVQKDLARFEQDLSKFGTGSVGNINIPSTTLAARNNNPGNLRFVGQTGAVEGENGFARFNTPEEGFQALIGQINLDASRGLNLREFISKYAPPSENDTELYIDQMESWLGTNEDMKISSLDVNEVAKWMAFKESGTVVDVGDTTQTDFETARNFIQDNINVSRAELKSALLEQVNEGNLDLDDGDVNALLDEFKITDEVPIPDNNFKKIAVSLVKQMGKEEAISYINDIGEVKISGKSVTLSQRQRNEIITEINNEYPEGRTFFQKVLPGGK